MDKDTRIAIIGAGAMGSAILRGWVASTQPPAADLAGASFIVIDPSADKREALASELGVSAYGDLDSATRAEGTPDMVLLAVKPQILDGALVDLAASDWFGDARLPLVVSIAAGIKTSQIEGALCGGSANAAVHVVRVMPNLPLQVMMGASVIARGAAASTDEAALVCDLFAALGFASQVEESQIDAVCAISGGGPAYVAKMIEDLTSAGVANGLSAELAQQLAITTVGGSFALMDETGIAPEALRKAVCSPGGTTLAALGAMDEGGFSTSIEAGVDAAIERAKELAR